MVDVTSVDTSASIFGKRYPIPLGFAPSAMQKLAGGDGEMDVASAARNLKINMTLSSQSTSSLEDVIGQCGQGVGSPNLWFQIYLTRDLERSLPLLKRAEGDIS